MNIDELKDRARHYWDAINVDDYQPVMTGPEPTEEQRRQGFEQAARIAELRRLYEAKCKEEGVQPALAK